MGEDNKDPKDVVITCINHIKVLMGQVDELNGQIHALMNDNDTLKTEDLKESLDLMYFCVYGASENIRQSNDLIFT